MAEHLAAKYGMSVAEAEQRLESLNRMGAAEGLKYDLARTQGGNTFAAHRLIHLANEKDAETGGALKEALLEAYFTDLQPVSEPDVLLDAAVKVGLDRDEAADVLETDRFAGEVRRDEAEAAALGCTGVPFFVFDRAFAVPGAQDPETFLATFRRAWDRSHPTDAHPDERSPNTVATGTGAGRPDDAACTDDSCAI